MGFTDFFKKKDDTMLTEAGDTYDVSIRITDYVSEPLTEDDEYELVFMTPDGSMIISRLELPNPLPNQEFVSVKTN